MMEWKIAKIRGTELGWEDHGFLTYLLDLDYGGSRQGFGHYVLGHRDWPKDDSKWDATHSHIASILEVVGVSSWEKVPGRTVFALADHGKVYGIRSLMGEREFFPGGRPNDVPESMPVGQTS